MSYYIGEGGISYAELGNSESELANFELDSTPATDVGPTIFSVFVSNVAVVSQTLFLNKIINRNILVTANATETIHTNKIINRGTIINGNVSQGILGIVNHTDGSSNLIDNPVALLFIDGFDHYNNVDLLVKFWTNFAGTNNNFALNSPGRYTSGQCLTVSYFNSNYINYLYKPIDNYWYGFAFKMDIPPSSPDPIFRVVTVDFQECVSLYVVETALYIGTKDNLTILCSVPLLGALDGWDYIEVRWLGNTSFEVIINDTPATSGATDFIFIPNVNAAYIGLGGIGIESKLYYFDDFYWGNNQLGSGRVRTFYGSSAGRYTEWGVIGATSNVLAINDTFENQDTSYVVPVNNYSNDSYNFYNQTYGGVSIGAIQFNYWSKTKTYSPQPFSSIYYTNTPEGTYSPTGNNRGGNGSINLVTFTPGSSYLDYKWASTQHPSRRNSWTSDDVNNFELGMNSNYIDFETTFPNGTHITQICIEVFFKSITSNTVNVSVTNTLTVNQIIENWRNVSVINTADTDQTIYNWRSIAITNTAYISHYAFVNSPRVVSVSNQGYIAQTYELIKATFYVSVANTLDANQYISARQGLYKFNIVSSANISSNFIPRDLTFSFSLTQNLNVTQKINLEIDITVISTADISQTYKFENDKNLFDRQNLTNTFSFSHETYQLISDVNILTNTYTHSGTYERDISQIQILKDIYRQVIVVSDSGYSYDPYPVGPGQPPIVILPHPVVSGTPVVSATQTILESSQATVILPAAEYGDTFAAKVETTVKKTMTGKIFTYNKTNEFDKFTLTWVLGLKKALELASVIEQNIQTGLGVFNFYVLTLWNGEIWYTKIVSTNIPITHEGRWQNSDNNNSEIEKMNVSIDFEGYRLL